MYWQDPEPDQPFVVPDDVVDVVFRLRCRELPVDHAHALSQALQQALHWLAEEPLAGVHMIHVAETGNGWQRPQAGGALLQLSKRTRLTLRLPRERLADVETLVDTRLQVGAHAMQVGTFVSRPLSSLGTLLARHVIDAHGEDEAAFLQRAAQNLQRLGIRVTSMLAGRSHILQFPQGPCVTRSLMVAGLGPAQAVKLQQHGIGGGRIAGCGLFIPHKSIAAVHVTDDNGS
jgi:CRISPR-associated protein Cas6